ncbi:MAG: 50S ribosomal protein L5 [bacterium]|nr:50S ribosomal protein L5 [bacterium]
MNALKIRYQKEILPVLVKEFGIANTFAVPRLVKVVINVGLGEALSDKKVIEKTAVQLSAITGQKPQETRAKRAISTFKLRAGDVVGLKVTLRGLRMYEFVLKLIGIALPRVRDFRGVPLSGFDGRGNYTLGLSEQTIFPEIEYNIVDKIRGLEVTFVSSGGSDVHSKRLLELLGLPFEKKT